MQEYLIAEEYTLPSKGLVYSKAVNPVVKIRSMTTNEEMKRLGLTSQPYKMISEIIDDCLVVKPEISSYDMCIADYQFLYHKLRIVTYGSDYKVNTTCPVCGTINTSVIDLESLDILEYSEKFNKYLNITLPEAGTNIQLRLQTPRMLDEIKAKADAYAKKFPNNKGESAILFTLQSIIETIDGKQLNGIELEDFIKNLPMRFTNYIIKSIDKINFGINTTIDCECGKCNASYKSIMPITGEFFGPDID